ncbi:unnamed protein product [Heterobilharzia americana]|nr:unnamed protein product [Heterobilharzia americana]
MVCLDAHNMNRSKSEQNTECSHCLNTYFTMSSSRHISFVAREIFPACLLAGIGMVFAGCYVDMLKSSGVLGSKGVNIFEIIPPVLGLKGNLEVALSSRLATVVHFHRKFSEISSWLFTTTLAFILILAIFASTIIPLVIVTVHISTSSISHSSDDIIHIVCISSVTCICATCLISVVVYGIVCVCVFFGANPDNIAPPTAAALGDLATVVIMARVHYYFMLHPTLTFTVAISMTSIVFILSISYLLYHSNVNLSSEFQSLVITRSTFKETIIPLILAILLSSISGNISSRFLGDLPIVARLQVPINATCVMRSKSCPQVSDDRNLQSDVFDFHSSSSYSTTGTTGSCRKLREIYTDVSQISGLIRLLCVPVHFILTLISVAVSYYLNQRISQENSSFSLQLNVLIPYILAGFMQICILLVFAKWIVLKLWKSLDFIKQFNSTTVKNTSISLASLDFSAIAMTTGLGDLLGTSLFIFFLCISKWLMTELNYTLILPNIFNS